MLLSNVPKTQVYLLKALVTKQDIFIAIFTPPHLYLAEHIPKVNTNQGRIQTQHQIVSKFAPDD